MASDSESGAQSNQTDAIFGPDFAVGGVSPDLTIVSSDRVRFYTYRQGLANASANSFGGLLERTSTSIWVLEAASVIELVLLVLYGMSYAHLNPSLETIDDALNALVKYGVPLQKFIIPSQPLYALLLTYAPFRPIEAYAVAAQHDLEEVAVAISAHLLAYDTSKLSDALTIKMGPVYFLRLLDLHRVRMDALKSIVLRPPAMHPVTPQCGRAPHGELAHAWALAAAQLAWDATPSTSTYALQSVFEKAGSTISCQDCRAMLHSRLQEVIEQWSVVKRTI